MAAGGPAEALLWTPYPPAATQELSDHRTRCVGSDRPAWSLHGPALTARGPTLSPPRITPGKPLSLSIAVNALPGLLDNEDDFTEARRRGLARFLEFIGRHPVLAEDEDVRYFYTEVDEVPPLFDFLPHSARFHAVALSTALRTLCHARAPPGRAGQL